MFGIHEISVYLLAIGLLTLLAAVLIWQTHRTGRTVIVWLAASVLGILLGCAGSYALVRLTGHEVVKASLMMIPAGVMDMAAESGPAAETPGGGPGGGPGGPRGMGGFGGPREPNPRRDLTTLVQKLSLLTGDVSITLSDQQAKTLCACLADLEKGETMSSDDAKAKHAEILAILDEKQHAKIDAIGLPRRSPGGSGGSGGPGGGEQAADANPFQQEANAQSLTVLRERFVKK